VTLSAAIVANIACAAYYDGAYIASTTYGHYRRVNRSVVRSDYRRGLLLLRGGEASMISGFARPGFVAPPLAQGPQRRVLTTL